MRDEGGLEEDDFEMRNLAEVDFGLEESQLNGERKKEVRADLASFIQVFQWDNTPVTFTHRIKHNIALKPGLFKHSFNA